MRLAANVASTWPPPSARRRCCASRGCRWRACWREGRCPGPRRDPAVVAGDLGLQRTAEGRAGEVGGVGEVSNLKARVAEVRPLVTAKSATSSTTLAQRPWKVGTTTPPAASNEKRPSSDSGWAARSPLALTSPLAAPVASSQPVADSVSLREAICPRVSSLSSAASLRWVRSCTEPDIAGDLGRPANPGLEEVERRQVERQVELAGRCTAPTCHDERRAAARDTSVAHRPRFVERHVRAARQSPPEPVTSSVGRPSAVTLLTVPRHQA